MEENLPKTLLLLLCCVFKHGEGECEGGGWVRWLRESHLALLILLRLGLALCKHGNGEREGSGVCAADENHYDEG